MRQALGWTAALGLALVAACGPGAAPSAEETATRASLQRDLTLGGSAPRVVEVASAVELGRPEAPRTSTPRRRSVPKPAPAPSDAPPKPEAAPAPEPVAVPQPVAVAALEVPSAAEPMPSANDRELAPGETITVIPASTGPSSGGGGEIGLPAEPGRGMWKGGAGNCPHPPRGVSGRPIGISRLPLGLPRR
jgi:hypothetical protein